MPVAVRPLPAALVEKAREEIFEDPKKLEDGIAHLKEWIAKQPHFNARTDDQWLAAFIRGSKFSLERAKEKIDLYYSMKTMAPELSSLKPWYPKFMEILKVGSTIVVPKTESPSSPRVIIIRPGGYDPNKYTLFEVLSISHYMQEIMFLEDDNFVVAGSSIVMDLKDASMAHFAQMSPVIMKKMIVSLQEAAPMRMKGVHYLNMPAALEALFNIAKTFMNEKHKKRIYVHGKDYDSFFKHIPRDIFPEEYGGNGGSTNEITDYWVKKFEEYEDWFADDDKYFTDESKRPGKPKTSEEMFGVEGSFRQLEFD